MKFAVVGDPVSHSLSPKMHQAAYAALGLTHTYEAIQVPAGSAASMLAALKGGGYRGVNVTVPLKEEALAACSPDAFARRCGAVNTIDFETGSGINTDGPGMVEVVREVEGERVLLLGAGGSAKAVAVSLIDAGYALQIWNRTPERAEALAASVGAAWTENIPAEGYDIAINATPSSMYRVELPITFMPNKTYIDLYYTKGDTLFSGAARAAGAHVVDGRELLVAQGALAFEFWLGVDAPRQAMRLAVGL